MAKDLQFQHSYFTEQKKAQDKQGAFSGQFTSYISDGNQALKDKTAGGMKRDQVLSQVRQTLVAQMQNANTASQRDAENMKGEHDSLRDDMLTALNAAKEAVRKKKILQAQQMGVDESIQGHQLAEQNIENTINRTAALEDGEDHVLTDEQKALVRADIAKLREAKTGAQAFRAEGARSFLGIKDSIRKMMLRSQIESQDKIIEEKKTYITRKADDWNRVRRANYRNTTFRSRYNAFDQAAFRLHMLSRREHEEKIVKKDVKEYVGNFDIDALSNTLDEMENNPYYQATITYKNYKVPEAGANENNLPNGANREGVITDDLIKSHDKITATSQEDENGEVKRFKLNSDFRGYLAKRQFEDGIESDDPTALQVSEEAKQQIEQAGDYEDRFATQSSEFSLKIDEKDYRNNLINTEDNIEIRRAKKGRWYNRTVVNGVFLNGVFISTERDSINGNAEYSLGMTDTWEKAKEREKIRRAVLKSSVFNMINSKGIQRAAGYGASAQAGADGIKAAIVSEIAEKCKEAYPVDEMEDKEQEKAAREETVRNAIFSVDYEKNITGEDEQGQAVDANLDVLPDQKMAEWEQILAGNNEEKKKAVPEAVKTKVLFDVLRQASKKGEILEADNKFKADNVRIQNLINGLKKDTNVIKKAALLLLADDNKPVYWKLAGALCKDVLGGRYDTAYNKARATGGQLLRVALIDELNKDRSRWNWNTWDHPGYELLMPDYLKQQMESFDGRRGAWAKIGQKTLNGTIPTMATSLAGGIISLKKGFSADQVGWGRMADVYSAYASAVTGAWTQGFIPDVAAYQISYFAGDTQKDEKGNYPQDTRRFQAGYVLTLVRSAYSLAKTILTAVKKRKENAKKTEDQKRFTPEDPMFLNNSAYQIITSLINVGLGSTAVLLSWLEQFDDAATVRAVGNAVAIVQNTMGIVQDNLKIGALKSVEKQFASAISAVEASKKARLLKGDDEDDEDEEDQASPEEQETVKILEENSQIQYGIACAKRKLRDGRVGKIFGIISNGGKMILNGIRSAIPEKVSKFIINGIEAGWDFLVSGAQTVTEVVRDKFAVRANLSKILGKEFKDVNAHQLNQVLRREAGIVDSNYLTDLARIFMSIDTHVFMKEAADNVSDENDAPDYKERKKEIGLKVAHALFGNKNYEYRQVDKNAQDPTHDENSKKLRSVSVGSLMGAYGVAGNFHTILKHSLKKVG